MKSVKHPGPCLNHKEESEELKLNKQYSKDENQTRFLKLCALKHFVLFHRHNNPGIFIPTTCIRELGLSKVN